MKLPKKTDLATICEVRLNNKLSCRNCSESDACKKFIKKHGNNPLQDYNIKIAEYNKRMEENEMAINKKNNENTESKFIAESIEVLRVKELKPSKNVDTLIACDLKINGIKIYGCYYLEGKKNGKEWSMIKLPETKGNDEKYYSIVWFPISKELTKKIADLIEKML